jgi:hypothetical protein
VRRMNRRVLTWGVLLAISALLIIGIQGSFADDSGKTSRFKKVEIQTTQYIWELVSGKDARVVCQVIVNHPTRPSNEEAIQACADQIFPSQPAPSATGTPQPGPTAIPFNLADFFNSVYWRFIATQELKRTIQVPLPEIITNLTVPTNQSAPYYAIITAYEPVFGERITSISGMINGAAFTCPSARCQVPIKKDSALEFWATSSFGDDSQHSQAAMVIVQKDNGQTLEMASLVPIPFFQDACSIAWGLPQINQPAWSRLPASPDDLNTMKPYQYLAGKLLAAGMVNASECPGGGLTATGGANTCGLQQTNQAVIDWQNRFDVPIWEAGRSLGVPPRMIKSLIAQESQFWPGNSRNIYSEYGLGQLSQSGADVALRWDNDLFSSICSGLIYDCSKIYGRLSASMQATMRGGLVRTVNSECADCPHGLDEARAYESIPLFARTLRSNCLQVNYIMRRHNAQVSYSDLWHFTLVSYHSGYECLKEALDTTDLNKEPDDWQHVSAYLQCPGSISYVEELWKSLLDFDKYRLNPAERPASLATFPVMQTSTRPAPTSTSTPAPILSLSHIRVLVYVDANKNNYPDTGEKVDSMLVTATFPDGEILNGTTNNGEVIFDLTGRPVDISVTVTLPEVYHSTKVRVIRDGEIPVIFRLEQPVVPPVLP